MCILCVIQKWSRRVATMLPWLVIPLIALWLLSQFLPPAFRFEITSPRLACVFVLLVTLFWYEVMMPYLSSWRLRRTARLRERKRFEAIELQKLRKTATRRCRNCLTPYRDQNPGGGKFMCSYCGHISKRPVLDLPVHPGLALSSSGILKDLVGKGGKVFNGKAWSENGWMCGQDWLDNANWVGGAPFSANSTYWGKYGGGIFGGADHCFAETSYSRLAIFVCKGVAAFFMSILWLWRKIFRISSSDDEASGHAESRGLAKRSENGVNCNESRGEKARRKAEEKRQARLEREQLEEEERKQREEVARLVEERRRLRDEKAEAVRELSKGSFREKTGKRDAEKKRQERKKEKDRGSSKSNSDVDELEKRAVKDLERSRKGDTNQRDHIRVGAETVKSNCAEAGQGFKGDATNNHRGNAGSRYLDRMRGSFLSSSRAFTRGGFFGRGSNPVSSVSREHRPNESLDHFQNSAKRESSQSERVSRKTNANADDRNINCAMPIESQISTAPKKSWQQLFTRVSDAPSPPNANVISRPNKSQTEAQGSLSPGYLPQSYDNPINFGLPSPFPISTFPYGNPNCSTGLPLSSASIFPRVGEAPSEFLPEESDIFEDPCYVPDPVSLIGPVSESLDNFQLDLGFVPAVGFEKQRVIKNMPASSDATRPSPIESPLSRLRASDERNTSSFLFPNAPGTQDVRNSSMDDPGNVNETGTWHMWNTSPLCQDSLGLVGGKPNWLLPSENRLNKEGVVHPASQKTMASLFKKDDQVPSNILSPQKLVLGTFQNGGAYTSSMHASTDGPWLQKTVQVSMSGSENHRSQEASAQNELGYGSPNGSASNQQFQLSQRSFWANDRNERAVPGSVEGTSVESATRTPIGGLYHNTDVQSLW